MNTRTIIFTVASVAAVAAGAAAIPAAPFTDNMVLQRGMRVPVWGTAQPGESVTVSFAGQTKRGTAGTDGRWRVDLDPMAASKEPRTLVIGERKISNVLVGEVWLASGQSNMEDPILGGHTRYRDGFGQTMTAFARRLALHALKDIYGFDDVIADSPTLKSSRVDAQGRFVLEFNDATSWYGYTPDNAAPGGFEIAGEDGVFHPAHVANSLVEKGRKGMIYEGRELIVASYMVKSPRRLRYLYSKPWVGSLYSGDSGLPLGPFEVSKVEITAP